MLEAIELEGLEVIERGPGHSSSVAHKQQASIDGNRHSETIASILKKGNGPIDRLIDWLGLRIPEPFKIRPLAGLSKVQPGVIKWRVRDVQLIEHPKDHQETIAAAAVSGVFAEDMGEADEAMPAVHQLRASRPLVGRDPTRTLLR